MFFVLLLNSKIENHKKQNLRIPRYLQQHAVLVQTGNNHFVLHESSLEYKLYSLKYKFYISNSEK